MRIIVTGGGTGGHVTPLKPVIDQLRLIDDSVEVLFVGQKNDRFSQMIEAGVDADEVVLISAGKYRRYPNESLFERLIDIKTHLLNVRDIFRIASSTIHSFFLVRRYKPDVVFGNGGFVSVPVGWAASVNNVPLVIHESDAKPGMATRILSSRATKILFGVPTRTTTVNGRVVEFVGIPLREVFTKKENRSQANLKKQLGYDPDRPLVTVSGGSLGAGAINTAVVDGLKTLLSITQIAHITGETNLDEVAKKARGYDDKDGYQTIGFTDRIDMFFRASDLVITRASATTFSELSALAKPTILIPAKQLSDQIENAHVLQSKQAVQVIDEQDLEKSSGILANRVEELLGDATELDKLSKAISELAKPNAAKDLARTIYKLGGSKNEK